MSQGIDLNALWLYVTNLVKANLVMPSLWRAMEAAKPIALENNEELIIGFPPAAGHQAGLLMDHQNRNAIEQALESATRVRLRLRLIDGETLEDWHTQKNNLVEAARLQEAAREQFRTQAESGQTWEAVGEQLIRKFSGTANRALPSVQGRYLEEALQILVDMYPRLMSADPAEQDERNYSRTLDRISERVGVPAALLAQIVQMRLSVQGAVLSPGSRPTV